MDTVVRYYQLRQELRASEYELQYLLDYGPKDGIPDATEHNTALQKELAELEVILSSVDQSAQHLHSKFVGYIVDLIEQLQNVGDRNRMYPDLNQGMTFYSSLFSMIERDIRYSIESGPGRIIPFIQYNNREWPAEKLLDLMKKFEHELSENSFHSTKDAIDYLDNIREGLNELYIELQNLKIIPLE